MQKLDNEKIIYVGFDDNGYFNSNGFLAINNATRSIGLGLYRIEKYNPLDLVPGTLKPVQISNTIENFSNQQVIIKLILDSNYQVLDSEYIRQDGEIIENILTNRIADKISGIYPGAFKEHQKDFTKLSEANVFLLVNKVIQTLTNMNFSNSLSNIDQSEKLEWEYAYDFCLAHLSRFGVEQQFDFKTKRMMETDSFKAWYQWWHEYFDYIMNDPDLSRLFYEHQRTCQNLKMFRPTGSFNKFLGSSLENDKSKTKIKTKSSLIAQEKVS